MKKTNKLATIYIILHIGLYYFWLFFWQDNQDMLIMGGHMFQFLAPLIGFIWLYKTYQNAQKKDQIFWLLLASGLLFYLIGEGIWIYYELFLKVQAPFPSWSDVFWIIQYGMYYVAFHYKMYSMRQSFSSIRFFFDIILIMIVAFSISWDLIIQPILSTSVNLNSLWFTVTYVGYPIGDLGLLFGAISLLMLTNETIHQRALVPIVVGFIIKVIANTIYAYLVINNLYSTGSYFDPLWSLSLLLIGLSGLYSQLPETLSPRKEIGPRIFQFRQMLPYVFLLVLFAFVLWEHQQLLDIMTAGFIVTLAILFIRQIYTLVKNDEYLLQHKQLSNELLDKNMQLNTMNQTLLEKEQQLTDVFNNLDAVIWSKDLRSNQVMVSTGVKRIFGFNREEFLENSSRWLDVIHPDDVGIVNDFNRFISTNKTRTRLIEFRIIHPDQSIKWVQILRTPMYDETGKLVKLHDVITEITERKNAEEMIHNMAYYDELTGLPNRNLFYVYLKKEISRSSQHNFKVAVMFIDLDRFKSVNDTLGHQIGDFLLQAVSERLKVCVHERGTVSRLGGDEFTIILPSNSQNDSQEMAKKIIEALNKPFLIKGQEIYVTPSIGISLFPDHGNKEIELIKKADMAMYHAKDSGKNTYQFYTSGLEKINARKMKIENALRKAIENEEFILYYQPKVELASGRFIGLEALIRWEHPDLGFVPPLEFIPISEETGLIKPLGDWVLKAACIQNKYWEKIGLAMIPISINVSAYQLNEEFVDSVRRVLQETDLDPGYLELEITESVMQNINKSIIILNALKDLGVKLSVDDFGTGYSSLSYLNHLPVDTIKIDKSFIDDIGVHSNGGVMVKTIIDMGKNLNFNVIAEGIEDPNQSLFLQQNNCRFGQGYFFSPPLPVAKIEEQLISTQSLIRVPCAQ